eukprot:TRINITY_DN462_c0_g1_i6.p1 TRINITY_DN462_c0_g1~~TRINITY_DN462_c0_g1_i6.p1  ORF type:complete len:105 (-),score=20.88 TRINITY_DN462_c0_g1_i6:250-564(-)
MLVYNVCYFFFFFFKQKTAYEMLRSLVGSEMCIRDRICSLGKVGNLLLGHLLAGGLLGNLDSLLGNLLDGLLGLQGAEGQLVGLGDLAESTSWTPSCRWPSWQP